MNQENERIRSVYTGRDTLDKKSLYAWYRPEVRRQEAEKEMVAASLISRTVGTNLNDIQVLDIGCGTGTFLRNLIEWGGDPVNLTGSEFLEDRLDVARIMSPSGINWHLGNLDFASQESFDFVITNTVFSSVLDVKNRQELAKEMWRVLKPGGWLMIFDFRYNNPSNKNVKRVVRSELREYWPESINEHWQTLLLAPPIARRLVPLSPLTGSILEATVPFLRSHFYFLSQKPKI